ncbi:family 16 glycosylhydrolase [Dactylosporangium vinaceum]|uniref:Ricin-type beta-trefoil lectin domain protein n=1 Tax=Dactylosporangium vinaceum TaxID=53362 RepID=A0ABV5MMJ9_9ACTN|nr:glycoside hydrolase family 16 protein [Dactylosporangium vinaceum]UAB93224.1 family 16 glycosylhydrolase [Dactylosporangium vinaceum]
MRRLRSLASAALMATIAATGLVVAAAPTAAQAAVVWNEDFSGAGGQGVDAAKWNFDTGGGGFGNSELEYYNSGTSNVYQDGQGHLVIEARRESGGRTCWYGTCQWTSGRIQTAGKFTQQYGHIEARIQVPKGNGLWPAFWMLGGGNWPGDGEIDIMENVGRDPNTVYGTIHGPGYSGGNAVGGTRNIGQPLGNAYHTFAVDWSPNLIVWTIDGSEYFRATPASTRGNPWVYDHPFFIILNLAVGGSFPGSPDGSTPSLNRMLVDYVHVSTSSTTPPPGGSALRGTESGRCIDIPAANPADGVRLQVYDCNGTAAQQWTIGSDGTVRALGKCMDAAGAATANGTAIQLYSCNGTNAQKFTLSAAGDLVNIAANRCVDVAGHGTANGSQLQLWDCTGAGNQKWTRA